MHEDRSWSVRVWSQFGNEEIPSWGTLFCGTEEGARKWYAKVVDQYERVQLRHVPRPLEITIEDSSPALADLEVRP